MVEYALILPLLLLLLGGSLDLARGVWAYNTIDFLARDGARYGTVPTHNILAVQNHVDDRCKSMLLSNSCDATIEVQPLGTCPKRPGQPLQISVRVAYPLDLIFPFKSVIALIDPGAAERWHDGPLSLHATSQMYVEGCPT
jgi:Flp pilus assembly protein TadG